MHGGQEDKADEVLSSIAASESEVAWLVRQRAASRGLGVFMANSDKANSDKEGVVQEEQVSVARVGSRMERASISHAEAGNMRAQERVYFGEMERELELEIQRQIQLDQIHNELMGQSEESSRASGQWM